MNEDHFFTCPTKGSALIRMGAAGPKSQSLVTKLWKANPIGRIAKTIPFIIGIG